MSDNPDPKQNDNPPYKPRIKVFGYEMSKEDADREQFQPWNPPNRDQFLTDYWDGQLAYFRERGCYYPLLIAGERCKG